MADKSRFARIACAFSLIAALSSAGAAAQASQAQGPAVAFIGLENRSGDPRWDYLSGFLGGLLQYDLTKAGVELLERRDMDAVLTEQELSLSGVIASSADSRSNAKVGQLLGARYLVLGDYVLTGELVLLTVKLVDVETGKAQAYSEGGKSDNLAHAVAERIAEKLGLGKLSFREAGRERSIMTLRDETPGSIALHSPLVDARIYLDDAFVGYTKGDSRTPILLENLAPGRHVVRTHLTADFGVVKEPEITFSDWSLTVDVASGKRAVIEDQSTHFNDIIYHLKQLFSKSETFVPAPGKDLAREYPISYVDRKGAKRGGAIRIKLATDAKGVSGTLDLEADGKKESIPVACEAESAFERKISVGNLEFSVELTKRYSDYYLELGADRLDLEQGMHRE